MKTVLVAAVAVALSAGSLPADILDGFGNPGYAWRPETWLQVSGGNASKEGMTRDLEAIASAGFSGVQFFHESFSDRGAWPGTTGQIPCMSSNWVDFIVHTAKECRRLGLRFLMHGCPGWSMAGGPWVPDDKAMHEIVFSRTDLAGGTKAPRLPRPAKADDAPWRDYRDIAVVAFPKPAGDNLKPIPPLAVKGTRTSDYRLVREYYSDAEVQAGLDDEATSAANWRTATDGGEKRFAFTNENAVAEVELDFGRPVTVRTVEISPVQRFNHFWSFQPDVTVSVFAGTDGGWRKVSERKMPQSSWQDEKPISLALPETTARRFRVEFFHAHPLVLSSVRFYSGARPDNWEAEGARTLRALMPDGEAEASARAFVDPSTVVDLTAKLSDDGTLDWTVPDGEWTVLRIGNVNSGIRNHPAPPEATGWECDKLSTAGADASYDGYIGMLASGPLAGGLLGGLLMDSWECEAQTWTPGLDRIFRERWGYGLETWWPALVGFVVKDRRATSLFYRDWRELLGDLVFENFYGHLSRRAHESGQFVTYETCGCDVFPGDPMKHWKYADEPMCEFWRPRTKVGGVGSPDYKAIRPCVSAARIYGKPRVSAEALTFTALDWKDEYPRAWKADLDHYFALGVTHMVFENYTHTPQIGFLPPGTGYGSILGSILMRGQTWWGDMREVTDYLARASYLLESGKSVSDVLLYLGDRVDHKPYHHLPFPKGFSYDYLNKDAFLSRIEVKDGLWTTPEGLVWKALWLYDDRDLRPETVAKLAGCERAGGKVIRGDVFAGVAALGLKPQVRRDGGLLWQHRRTDAEEVYFFAEEDGKPFDGTVEVEGVGEAFFADPVTGKVEPANEVSFRDGFASVRLTLGRSGAKFLVIRRGEAKPCATKPPSPSARELTGRWTLSFEKGWGRDEPVTTECLASWHELPGTEEQRSYSGTVRYALEFTADAAIAQASRLILDLGEVETSAAVNMNGEKVGLRWTWPYRFDVTGKVRTGANRLEVAVTGSWHNRLRYDATLPVAERKTWTLGYPKPEKSPLLPSGLLGPVRLLTEADR